MIRFNLAIKNNEEYLYGAIRELTNRGFIVTGLKECDILRDGTDEKTGEAYVVECKGHAWDYLQFRKELITEYKRREFKFEGVRTLG